MKLYLCMATILVAATAIPALAAPVAIDSPAVLTAKQTRLDVAQKKQALAEEQRIELPAPAATPAAPLALAIDETDSPGATK